MLIAYMVTAFAQSAPTIWLSVVRANPFQAYTVAQEVVAYFVFGVKVLSWPLCFAVVHEILNGYLAPYRALQSVGQTLFRAGTGLAMFAVITSALVAPQEVRAALTYLSRSEPLVIYGCATALCLGVAGFVWHFQLRGSLNDEATFMMVSLIFGQFALLWGAEHLFSSPSTRGHWGMARVIIAAPILVFAAMKLSPAGEMRPLAAVAATGQGDVRRALEDLNASLERGTRP